VAYLAAQTGHKFVRINNHQHTELSEYLGSYVADEAGRLVFREGALVQALRQGHWVVLDELNLAPTEVRGGASIPAVVAVLVPAVVVWRSRGGGEELVSGWRVGCQIHTVRAKSAWCNLTSCTACFL
jgi:hypothetical protein